MLTHIMYLMSSCDYLSEKMLILQGHGSSQVEALQALLAKATTCLRIERLYLLIFGQTAKIEDILKSYPPPEKRQ